MTWPALAPPDAQTPSAGVCASNEDPDTVEVVLGPDVPTPRCVVVTSAQHLVVVNESEPTSVRLGTSTFDLGRGESVTFRRRLGDFLAPGVHRLRVSTYGGAGPELWLKN